MTDPVRTVGVVGTGVIGAGWTVRVLARGHDVLAWDPAPDAEDRLRAAVERDWPSAVKLGLFPRADPSRLMWADSAEDLAGRVDWIQESAPENELHPGSAACSCCRCGPGCNLSEDTRPSQRQGRLTGAN